MDPLTNNRRKLYASLDSAKGRKASGLFMAQGTKCVADTIDHFVLTELLATASWADSHKDIVAGRDITIVKNADLQRISTLSTPPEVIAVYRIPEPAMPEIQDNLVVALDCVQDPGNLGTIMRVADWMGIKTILASEDTADVWNPKTVQATMGAISRVKVCYTNLPDMLGRCVDIPVYGTYLDGKNIYDADLTPTGIIVMGNEGRGISPAVTKHVTNRLFIPPFPPDAETSESLNVAVATAITLSEFRRRS